MSKLWVCISKQTGMPITVEKCEFMPTIHPRVNSEWERVYSVNELMELEHIESQIVALQDQMRPLLDKWKKLIK